MGYNLNKLIPSSLTASGSGDDGSSGIVQFGSLALAVMLMLQVFAGGALAADYSDTGVDFEHNGDGLYGVSIDSQSASMNASETDTLTVEVENGVWQDNLSASEFDAGGLNGSEITLDSVTKVNDTTAEFQITANEDLNGAYISISNFNNEQIDFTSESGSVTVTDSSDTEIYSGTYSAASDDPAFSTSSEPATGTVELGNISTYDNGSVDSVDVMIYNSSGDRVVNDGNITDLSNYSTELETGDYTYTLVADGYADADSSFSVTENNTTALDPSFGALQVDYDFTVEQDGDALSNFTFNIYEGDSIGENESALSSAESDAVGGNTISVSNLDDSSDYTVAIVYNDSDGNETTYTETITVDSSQVENGSVSQTVDVASDSTSDDGGFIGGVPSFDNPLGGISDAIDSVTDQLPDDPAMLALTLIAGFVGIVGTLFVLIWTLVGIRTNRRI